MRRVGTWHGDLYALLTTPLVDVVGDKTAKALSELGLGDLRDLLYHLPRRYLSGSDTTVLSEVVPGEDIAVIARIGEVNLIKAAPQRHRLEVLLTDGSAQMRVTFFGRPHYVQNWHARVSRGPRGLFVGRVGWYKQRLQMTHPTFVIFDDEGRILDRPNARREAIAAQVQRSGLVGIYPATSRVNTWQIADCVDIALTMIKGVSDPMPEQVRHDLGVPDFVQACRAVHQPDNSEQAVWGRRRLVVEEALSLQLVMARRRAELARQASRQILATPGGALELFDARLPFAMTAGQMAVSAEISADLAGETPMRRLLQGEVGSGKTVVALRAMLAAVDAGYQAVLLAPTEVLAEQHHRSITGLLGDLAQGGMLGAPPQATGVVLLTGSVDRKRRAETLTAIADGSAGVIVGTHALLSDQVDYRALGLVVIDEQHRFGVQQRAVLQHKAGWMPHTLVLTATPIPRSVAMTIFGDLEVSTLRELPGGRQDVQTTVVDLSRHPQWLNRVWQRVGEEVGRGRQVFVVCPRIGEQDKEGAGAAAIDLTRRLTAGPLGGLRVGLLHGRLPSEQKSAVMGDFVAGEVDVLVATTVIEVGVDVPNASMMIIMDADRFGISQLHQLRGRIGRGEHRGLCLLVSSSEYDSAAASRLAAVAATQDGFALAEADLVQRREGNILGTRQSGRAGALRLVDTTTEQDIIEATRNLAIGLVAADPDGQDPWLADLATVITRRADLVDYQET